MGSCNSDAVRLHYVSDYVVPFYHQSYDSFTSIRRISHINPARSNLWSKNMLWLLCCEGQFCSYRWHILQFISSISTYRLEIASTGIVSGSAVQMEETANRDLWHLYLESCLPARCNWRASCGSVPSSSSAFPHWGTCRSWAPGWSRNCCCWDSWNPAFL